MLKFYFSRANLLFWVGVLTFLSIGFCSSASGVNGNEDFTVKGKVSDSLGNPLIGVSVNLKGATTGALTNANGNYSLDIGDGGDTLVFTYVGYITQEIPVDNHRTINVTLRPTVSALDELVVVAMGKQKKESVVGSISSVKMDRVSNIPTTSVSNAIAGRLAGGVSVQRTGEIGRNASQFWIRGISTFSSGSEPLILVDGIERGINDVSIDEISSISILKDAAATAVYGSKAANGVVLITTKQGVSQEPQIEVNIQSGMTDLPTMPKFLDGQGYAKLYNEALGKENYSADYIQKTGEGIDRYLYPNVNWFDEVFRRFSHNSRATVNVNGGGNTSRYFVSFGYYNETGNLKNDSRNDYKSNMRENRYNFRANVDVDLFSTTTVKLQLGGYLSDLHTPGVGGTIYSSTFSPAQELFHWANLSTPLSTAVTVPIGEDIDGNKIMGWGAPTQVGEMNPAERLFGSGYDESYQSKILSQLIIEQDLGDVLDGLSANVSFSFDAFNNTNIQRRKSSTTYGTVGRDASGELITTEVDKGNEFLGYSRALGSNRAEELRGQINYHKIFSQDHEVGGMVMYYQRDYRVGNAGNSITSLPQREQGFASRLTYNYINRYFLEVDMGYNGSENFQKGKRFGFFPAVGAGWMISKESFWKPLTNAINVLKLKGSSGLVGSQVLPGGSRFAYLTIFGGGLGGYSFGGESPTAYPGVGLDRSGITDLTWEKGFKNDVGIEMELLDGMISLEADYFHEKRSNILTQRISLPAIVGINNVPFANIGRLVNQGIEGTMSVSKAFSEDFSLRFYGNFTYVKNKILNMDEPPRKYDYQQRTGHPSGQQFGLIALGYFKDSADILKSPEQTFGQVRPGDVKYEDVNGDGKVDVDDEVAIGYANIPQITYGFGAQAQIKGFDLGVFFRGQAKVTYPLGGEYIPFSEGVGKHNLYVEALNRWTPENPDPNAQYPRLFDGRSANNWQPSSKNIYDGSFIRLQTVEVGYTFSAQWMKDNLRMKNLRIYFVGDNLALFSPWKMWDPETGTSGGTNYPPQRKFNFGLRVNF